MLLKGKEFKEHPCGLFVASDGEVYVPRNNSGKKEHFTFGTVDSNGYLKVKRNRKQYSVHKLVAECFLDNPDNLPTVDHIDRDRTNNNVENLRWASRSLQSYNRGKYTRPNTPKNNACSKKVLQYTLDGQLVMEWPSAMECHRNGFNTGNVCSCCRGELKTHKGYRWEYAD